MYVQNFAFTGVQNTLFSKNGEGAYFLVYGFVYFKLWYFSCKIFGGGIMYEIEL